MSAYKYFPQSNLIRDWGELLKLNREEVASLYEQWKEIEKENGEVAKQLYEKRSLKLQEAENAMKALGIDVFKYKGTIIKQKNGYQAWFKKNVADVIFSKYTPNRPSMPYAHPTKVVVNGIELYNNQSPTNLVELYDKIAHQYQYKRKELDKNNKLLIKSVEYATANGIDIEGLESKDIICIVEEVAKDKYLKEEFPNGTEVYLKHGCDECSTYIMGERRCSCGNRRISIVVEGDLINGFYHYPEPY